MKYEDLAPELREKIGGKTPEELLEMAKTEGYSLSDEELDAISGGMCGWDEHYVYCTKCKAYFSHQEGKDWQTCPACGEVYLEPLD